MPLQKLRVGIRCFNLNRNPFRSWVSSSANLKKVLIWCSIRLWVLQLQQKLVCSSQGIVTLLVVMWIANNSSKWVHLSCTPLPNTSSSWRLVRQRRAREMDSFRQIVCLKPGSDITKNEEVQKAGKQYLEEQKASSVVQRQIVWNLPRGLCPVQVILVHTPMFLGEHHMNVMIFEVLRHLSCTQFSEKWLARLNCMDEKTFLAQKLFLLFVYLSLFFEPFFLWHKKLGKPGVHKWRNSWLLLWDVGIPDHVRSRKQTIWEERCDGLLFCYLCIRYSALNKSEMLESS